MNIVTDVCLTSETPITTDRYDIVKIIKLSVILNAVCEENEANPFLVKSKDRSKDVMIARKEYCYIAYKLTQLSERSPISNSLAKVGAEIGLDHSTVFYHIKTIKEWLNIPAYNLKEKLEGIEKRLKI